MVPTNSYNSLKIIQKRVHTKVLQEAGGVEKGKQQNKIDTPTIHYV